MATDSKSGSTFVPVDENFGIRVSAHAAWKCEETICGGCGMPMGSEHTPDCPTIKLVMDAIVDMEPRNFSVTS